MERTRRTNGWAQLLGCALVALGGALYGSPAAAVTAPTATSATNGSYTVSYAPCACLVAWLEERAEGGAWTYVGQGAVGFAGKPNGNYYYRVGNYYSDYYSYYGWTDYSPEIRVTVGVSAPAEPLESQLLYRYETRYGDGNGDGRADLLVNRIAGGASGNGTIETVMLLQSGGGQFTTFVPSAAQAAVAKTWPQAAVEVVLRDFNVDGFVDVLLKGVASTIGGGLNQIVYASARAGVAQPLGVRAVDSRLKRFASNSLDYFANTDYFAQSAPVSVVVVPVSYLICYPSYYYDYYYGYGACSWFESSYETTVRDYSVFDATAVNAWSTETSIDARSTTPEQGVATIKQAYESAIGAPIGGRDWGGASGERARLDDPTYRRGFDLFAAIFGISEANAQDLDPPRNPSRNQDVVYLTGRHVLGFLPLHTALEYRGSTLSAFDSDDSLMGNGLLVSRPNAASDKSPLMMTLGTVSSTLGAAGYWSQLVTADARYPDNLPYNPVPSTGNGYNSNGFTHGLVQATAGSPSVNMFRYVGGEKPVPANLFH